MIQLVGLKELALLSIAEQEQVIDTSATSKTWARGLSPSLLGPVLLPTGHVSKTMENGYRYSRVYPGQEGALGLPTEDYWLWAEQGWANPKAVKYPMGVGARPLYTYWKGRKLDAVESRERAYKPLYINAVRDTDAFARLEREYHNRDKQLILFVDEDSRIYQNYGLLLVCLLEGNLN